MKTFVTLLCIALLTTLAAVSAAGQNFLAVKDSICIYEDELSSFTYNVLDNDIIPDSVFIVPMGQSSCFFLDELGEIHVFPDANNCCEVPHKFKYRIVGCDFGPPCMAEVIIMVKCRKPDCALVDLDELHDDGAGTPGGGSCLSACEFSTATYFVSYNPLNSYTWTVTGGTFAAGGNPAEIIVSWGAAGSGIVTLSVNGGAPKIFCADILSSPIAGFTIDDASPCLNSPVSFTNTSVGGSGFYWDFGDGNTSTMPNPSHEYGAPGQYTVCLLVTKNNYDEQGNPLCCCTDTLCQDVVVDSLPGPNIYCLSTLCAFDSTKYWTDASNCSTYTWTAVNADGSPATFTGQGTDTICVQWGAGPFGTITLQVSGCDQAYCTDPVTLTVPIISNTVALVGPNAVCAGSTSVYSAPKWISAWYAWTVTGGTILEGDSTHTITVQWGPGPTGTIQLNYGSDFLGGLPGHDPEDCGGSASLTVSIKPEFEVVGPQGPFCVGDQSSFFATPAPWGNYNWTVTPAAPFTGNGSSSIVVTWPAPGAYVVSAVPTNNTVYCNSQSSALAIVVEVMPPDSIEGPLEICPDDIATYFGYSAQTNVKYVWNVTGGTPSTYIGNPVTVDWDPTGPYGLSLQMMQLGAPACMSAPLSVNIAPKTITGPVSINSTGACVNKQENYTASLVQGHPDAVFTWSITPVNAGSVIGGQGSANAMVQWNNIGGSATVSVVVTLCNQTLNGTLSVLVGDPMVGITQSGNLCPGQTATLTATTGFNDYDWTPSASGQTITINTGGIYVVTATTLAGCTAVASFTAVSSGGPVASISTADLTTLCINPPNNAMVNLVAQTNPNYNFVWFCNGSPQSQPLTQATFKHTNSNVPGTFTYYVVVTDVTTGCTAQSNSITVTQVVCTDPSDPCVPAGNFTLDIVSATAQNPDCNIIDFDANASNVTGIVWNFADPNSNLNTGALPDATHAYTQAGCYLVSVTGQTPALPPNNTCTVGDTISVCVPLVADFDVTVSCLVATFTDQSTYLPGEGPVSYTWDYGDGNVVSAGPNPMHMYTMGGLYTVSLTVTNADGCQSVYSQLINVDNLPSASASAAPPSACVGQPVQFTGTNTGTSTIIDWLWNFGDASTNGAEDPAHSYLTAGAYGVVLTVTDAAGCTALAFTSVTVFPAPAPGVITFTPGLSGCPGDLITLTAPAGASWSWTPPAGNVQSVNVTTSGTYSVTVTDANGCSSSPDSVDVVIFPAPQAIITGNPVICDQGCTVLSASGGFNYSWQWLDASLNPIPGEVFQTLTVCDFNLLPGGYAVSVTDDNGCTAVSPVFVVSVKVSPSFTLNVSPMPACEGDPTTLTVVPVQPNVIYTWNTGATGTSITVLQAGTYTVIGTDTLTGCTGSASAQVNPLPDLCIVPVGCYKACDPDTICGPDGMTAYQWNLNGLPIAGATDQCYIVTESGTYTLTATNEFGCSDTSDSLILMLMDCGCEGLTVSALPSETDSCCWTISYNNPVDNLYGVLIHTDDAEFVIDPGSLAPSLEIASLGLNFIGITNSQGSPQPDPMPQGVLADFLAICLSDVTSFPQQIVFDWYDFNYDVVCSDTLIFDCPVEPDCLYAKDDTIYCENGVVTYTVTLCNPIDNDFNVGYIVLDASSPSNVVVTPSNIFISPPLAPGECRDFTFLLSGANIAGEDFCFSLTAHDVPPGNPDTSLCCMLDTMYCVEIPDCDPCDNIGVEFVDMVSSEDGGDCCAFIGLHNNYAANYFDGIDLCLLPSGTTMTMTNPFGSGWATASYSPTMISLDVIPPLGNTLPLGPLQLPMLCFQTQVAPPQFLEIKWMQGDSVVCRDTITLMCEPPCGYISADSISCQGNGSWSFLGILHNTSDFPMGEAQFVFPTLGYSQTVVLPPLLPGGTQPFGIPIGAPAMAGDTICFTVALHEVDDDSMHINCCNFHACLVLPDCPELLCACDEDFYGLQSNGYKYAGSLTTPYEIRFAPGSWLSACDRVLWAWGDASAPDTAFGNMPLTHQFPGNGTYDVCMSVTRLSDSGEECRFEVCNEVKINPYENNPYDPGMEMSIYPNPAEGAFYVSWQTNWKNPVQVSLYDLLGRKLAFERWTPESGENRLRVDPGFAMPGIYFVEVVSNGKRSVHKVVLQ